MKGRGAAVHRLRILAIGPGRGGVKDAFASSMSAFDSRPDVHVETGYVSAGGVPLLSAFRTLFNSRRALRDASTVHVEFGSNDVGAFLCAALLVGRYDVVVVVHDVPKVCLAPGAGLVSTSRRPGRILGYRLLSPLADDRMISRVVRRARAVVVLSDAAAENIAARGGKPVVIAHGGSGPSPDAPPPSLGRHVLFAGHIGPSKGLHVLLEAWGRLRAARLPLVIAGPTEPGASDYVARLKGAGGTRVEWRGVVEAEAEFQRLFAEAAVVVLPYERSSPASGVLVRALSEGRAVIATDVPAVRDVVREAPDALLCVPRADPMALSDALERVIADPELRDRYGRAAASFARRFDWTRTTAELVALYGAGEWVRGQRPRPARRSDDDVAPGRGVGASDGPDDA